MRSGRYSEDLLALDQGAYNSPPYNPTATTTARDRRRRSRSESRSRMREREKEERARELRGLGAFLILIARETLTYTEMISTLWLYILSI